MADNFPKTTNIGAAGADLADYLDSIFAKLTVEDDAYRTICEKINGIYQQYPKVFELFDGRKTAALTERESAAIMEIRSLREELVLIEEQAVYFRGCYDSIDYLKRAGVL